MATIETLLLWTVLCATVPDPVLLQFSSENCPPCRSMQPIVQQLSAEGMPIQQIDVNQDRATAARFQVRETPTFIVFAGGKEVARHRGATDAQTLRKLMMVLPEASDDEINNLLPVLPPEELRKSIPEPIELSVAEQRLNKDPVQRAKEATVRLKVEDPKGISYGTGTIVDAREGEALVVTCAHIFRASQGKGTINVEIYTGTGPKTVAGELIVHDMQKDVAFVSMQPGMEVAAVQIAPAGFEVAVSQPVFSLGCDKGAKPTIRDTQITAIDRYTRPNHFCVSFEPSDGRSGGGLFSWKEGYLIGICNAAIPSDREGLFAGLKSVQSELDEIGHSQIYARASMPAEDNTAEESPAPPRELPLLADVGQPIQPVDPSMNEDSHHPRAGEAIPEGEPSAPAGLASLASGVDLDDTEVICIVRSRKNPQAESRVFVVNNVTPELMSQISKVSQPKAMEGLSMTSDRSKNGTRPSRQPEKLAERPSKPSGGVILRGQSDR